MLLEYEALWHQAWLKGIDNAKAQLQATLLTQDPRTGAAAPGRSRGRCWHQQALGGLRLAGRAALQAGCPCAVTHCIPPLSHPHLLHTPAGALLVNFDADVLQLMREARYMQRLGLDTPPAARAVLLQEEKFALYHAQLTHALQVPQAGGCWGRLRVCGGQVQGRPQRAPAACRPETPPHPHPTRRSWSG